MNDLTITRFLDALVSHKMVDSAPYKEGRGALVISDKVIPFSIKEKGFAVGGENPVECYCPNPEASLVRVLSSQLFGTTDVKFKDKIYNSVNVYPKAIRSDGVLFATADGKEFLASSSNTRVTLGLYDILYSRNADSSVLMLPELLPSGADTVAIASSKTQDYFVSPKTEMLSSFLTTITDEVIVTGDDTVVAEKINSIYSDKSKLGDAAPLNEDIAAVAPKCILSSVEHAYRLSSDISLDNGFRYHLEEEIKPEFGLVQSSVSAANHVLCDLEDGVILGENSRQVIKNLRVQPKAISERSTLSYSEEVSSGKRVSDFWGIPVYSNKLTSYVWSY